MSSESIPGMEQMARQVPGARPKTTSFDIVDLEGERSQAGTELAVN